MALRRNINKPNKDGYTPLAIALLFLDEETPAKVQALLDEGANPNVFIDGLTARVSLERHVASRTVNRAKAAKLANQVLALLEAASGGVDQPSTTRDEQEERAMLLAIPRAGSDQAALQVYADWLLERGIGWGEVVQAQLGSEDAKTVKRLEKRHAAQWLEPWRGGATALAFDRALVSHARADAGPFFEHHATITARLRDATLELRNLWRADQSLLKQVSFEHVTMLNLEAQRLSPAVLSALLDAGALHHVKTLALGWNELGPAFPTLCSTKKLPALERLELTPSRLTDLEELFASRTLRPSALGLCLDDFEDLPSTCELPLRRLALNLVFLPEPKKFAALLSRPWMKQLEALEFNFERLEGGQHKAFVRQAEQWFGRLPKLRSVETFRFIVTPDGVKPNESTTRLFGRQTSD